MRKKMQSTLKLLSVITCLALTAQGAMASEMDQAKIKDTVDSLIQPLMQKNNIPGMSVAVTLNGKNYIYNYGLASKQPQQPVTDNTLFEVGSLSKTFAATLASYAQVSGKLSLDKSISHYVPELRGSSFDHISVLNAGTHTTGLALFMPEEVKNTDQLMAYLKAWKPADPAGTYRVYSNIGTGLLGMIAAQSMGMTYEDAIEKTLLPKLGMTHTYLNVPADQAENYAWGYNKKNEPIHVNMEVLGNEAYGIRTNASDLIRYVQANMGQLKLDGNSTLQKALTDTHTGYFKSGKITQDLMWEQLPYPVSLPDLLTGNDMAMTKSVATPIVPPLPPQENVWINKTGSTNGFGAYIAFVPAKKMGIVMLANKNYSIDQRVTVAYKILSELEGK